MPNMSFFLLWHQSLNTFVFICKYTLQFKKKKFSLVNHLVNPVGPVLLHK